jgi:hypothetical protein
VYDALVSLGRPDVVAALANASARLATVGLYMWNSV